MGRLAAVGGHGVAPLRPEHGVHDRRAMAGAIVHTTTYLIKLSPRLMSVFRPTPRRAIAVLPDESGGRSRGVIRPRGLVPSQIMKSSQLNEIVASGSKFIRSSEPWRTAHQCPPRDPPHPPPLPSFPPPPPHSPPPPPPPLPLSPPSHPSLPLASLSLLPSKPFPILSFSTPPLPALHPPHSPFHLPTTPSLLMKPSLLVPRARARWNTNSRWRTRTAPKRVSPVAIIREVPRATAVREASALAGDPSLLKAPRSMLGTVPRVDTTGKRRSGIRPFRNSPHHYPHLLPAPRERDHTTPTETILNLTPSEPPVHPKYDVTRVPELRRRHICFPTPAAGTTRRPAGGGPPLPKSAPPPSSPSVSCLERRGDTERAETAARLPDTSSIRSDRRHTISTILDPQIPNDDPPFCPRWAGLDRGMSCWPDLHLCRRHPSSRKKSARRAQRAPLASDW